MTEIERVLERVLVAHGSKYGATEEIAEVIAASLRRVGFEVDVLPARQVRSLGPYQAVVLGSAIYMGRWRRDALRLLGRPQLADRELWVFSSGPVGHEARRAREPNRWTHPPVVVQLAANAGANDVVVFGGRIDTDRGLVRRRMAAGMPKEFHDCRDWDEIEAFAASIAASLKASSASTPAASAIVH